MKIVHIQYPYAITDDGCRIAINSIEGNVVTGVHLKVTDSGYKVDGAASEVCEV